MEYELTCPLLHPTTLTYNSPVTPRHATGIARGLERQRVTSSRPIYLDYHAHAPIDPRVAAVLSTALTDLDANPHSGHRHGEAARAAVEECRRDVATLLRSDPSEIIILSGATEANNLALKGLAAGVAATAAPRILVGAGEHPSVIAAANAVQNGAVELVPLDSDGTVDMDALSRLLARGADIVSIAGANHEIGTIQPIAEIARLTRGAGAILHSDLAQCAGRIAVDGSLPDAASVSAHKFGGPIGVGALMIRRRLRRKLQPMLVGGGQEGGLRAGTVSPPLCVAFGTACRIAVESIAEEVPRVTALRDDLLARLGAIGGLHVNGGPSRLPGNLNVSFDGVDGEALVIRVRDRLSISTGSACTSSSIEPSHVLSAIGVGPNRAEGAIRFGLGRFTTPAEIGKAAGIVAEAVNALRSTLRWVA